MKFNEDSRVKIPALLHLTRLGYRYLSLKDAAWDASSNIFPAVFKDSIQKINPVATSEDIERTLQEIALLLDNEDLGKAFYERLLSTSGVKLIDFENFDANTFNVVTELPCIKDDEEFRPDITLLINGLPLVFIEVKKPNNRDGILAERNRIATRFQNPKFRRFVNITQLMMFSNNMEYDDTSHEPLAGAFYATTSYEKPDFNYFREENPSALPVLPPLDADTETLILSDNNLHALKHAPEYVTNCLLDTPTNRLSTSLFSRRRLAFLLRYGIAYVRGLNGFEKHIMRYLYYLLSSQHCRGYCKKVSTGSIHKGIRIGALRDYNFAKPDDQLIHAYTQFCEPPLKQKHTLDLQNQELTQLRDWLLPILMNGQVTVDS